MIERVQEHLESIYDFRCEMRVGDYLLKGRLAAQLEERGRTDEELLVAEDAAGLEVGLFLSPRLLRRLAPHGERPLAEIVSEELAAYCQLAEGVSHFMYLAFVADLERTVSLLELEVQAEIDKFATCALAHWGEGLGVFQTLVARLFDQVSYRDTLSPEERWRYEEANRLARAYCVGLLPLIALRRMDRLLGELRYAYRLGAEAKLRHLALKSRR